MPEGVPTKRILDLKKEGKANTEIIQNLQREGYSFQQISEALNQAVTKTAVESNPATETNERLQPSVLYSEDNEENEQPATPKTQQILPPPPTPTVQPSFSAGYQPQIWPQQSLATPDFGATREDIEEVAESIIDEKWQKVIEDIGDIASWREKTSIDIEAIKQELLRLENRFDNLQSSVIGKIREYDEGVTGVGIEIKALQKIMQNIIGPLTKNVKELDKITEKLRK